MGEKNPPFKCRPYSKWFSALYDSNQYGNHCNDKQKMYKTACGITYESNQP